jgi:ABC-type Na+ transport system ATPase subunit NatA
VAGKGTTACTSLYHPSLSNKIELISDVNLHKTNLFFRLNFQFVSISKRNILFYPYITVIEVKIKTNLFKNHKKKRKQNKMRGNFEFEKLKVKKNELFSLGKKQNIDILRQKYSL